jgi:hypothetical protein
MRRGLFIITIVLVIGWVFGILLYGSKGFINILVLAALISVFPVLVEEYKKSRMLSSFLKVLY